MSSAEWSPLPGMADLGPPEIRLWQQLESEARRILHLYRCEELRTPILERTSLFVRAIGEETDVVQKEMFTFEDRGGRSVTLRPEGTAGAIRALCNAGADTGARLYYLGPMFRAERPQAGRRRQFHQLGVEMLGPPSPETDAECIALMRRLLEAWGLGDARLRIHTRGTAADQPAVREGLRHHLAAVRDSLCEDCQRRCDRQPLRVLDCKQPGCRSLIAKLPALTSFLGEDSRRYLERVAALLSALGIEAELDGCLVRGLDYYEHTIWEATHAALGAQDALAGGGRYRIEAGGRQIEGVGFAIGLERVVLAMQAKGIATPADPPPAVWLVSVGDRAAAENLVLAERLRSAGVRCGADWSGRSVKAQMRAAHRAGATWAAIRGDDELAGGTCRLKHMKSGEERTVALGELPTILSRGAS
ncbi:MAG: histidine--tRNA ligase [Kiritimatiellae bacterium]|nr:histidine--tRNA ligase [Kiritimatiellia bacterium]